MRIAVKDAQFAAVGEVIGGRVDADRVAVGAPFCNPTPHVQQETPGQRVWQGYRYPQVVATLRKGFDLDSIWRCDADGCSVGEPGGQQAYVVVAACAAQERGVHGGACPRG